MRGLFVVDVVDVVVDIVVVVFDVVAVLFLGPEQRLTLGWWLILLPGLG